ncbi:hypothetical protein ACTFIV_001790 [Dictyostelium citrinum]
MDQQELIKEINNLNIKNSIENDSPEFESFFGYLPNDVKERKLYILKFNKTLREEKRKLKELKCKKPNKKCKREKNHNKHQQSNHSENKALFIKGIKSKNLEKKILQLNRKKQLIDSKINFLTEIKESNKTSNPL